MLLDQGRVGEQAGAPASQVAGEDEPPALAVLGEIELDDRRAQDVPGVQVGEADARHDLARLVVANPVEPLDDPLDVQEVEQGLGRLDVGMAEMGVAHVLALDPRAVAEHDAGDVGRGGRDVDRTVVPRLDQAREPADMVVVGVRDDDRVERAGVERELAVGAAGVDPLGIEEAAIEQQPVRADLQQMGATGDLPGRSMERDSQPTPSRRARVP